VKRGKQSDLSFFLIMKGWYGAPCYEALGRKYDLCLTFQTSTRAPSYIQYQSTKTRGPSDNPIQ
jgi:hypothetical protein